MITKIHPYLYAGLQNVPVKKTLSQILTGVCYKLDLSVHNVKSNDRHQNLVFARIIYSILALNEGYTFQKVGKFINRNHSTIFHYRNEYEKMEYNNNLKKAFEKCVKN